MAGLGDPEVVRITVPHKMLKRIEKQRLRKLRTEAEPFWAKKPVLISCKRRQFNHHLGQTYSDISVKDLASGNWRNRKHNMEYVTINSFKSVSLALCL